MMSWKCFIKMKCSAFISRITFDYIAKLVFVLLVLYFSTLFLRLVLLSKYSLHSTVIVLLFSNEFKFLWRRCRSFRCFFCILLLLYLLVSYYFCISNFDSLVIVKSSINVHILFILKIFILLSLFIFLFVILYFVFVWKYFRIVLTSLFYQPEILRYFFL